MRRMNLLISNRSFRLLFSATAISNLGDGVSALAFPWLASLITRDPTLIALVAFATRLPWLLFALPAGVLTDRADRRRLMVQADVFRLLLTGGVIALILSTPEFPIEQQTGLYIAVLAGFAFLLGAAEVVRDNAAQTVLPALVSNTDLERANGQLWTIEQIMGSFVGPPLAGLLIAIAVPAPFALDAVTFGLAAWMVWMIALPPRRAPERRGLIREIAEGWHWIRRHPTILRLAIMLGLMNAFHMMGATMLVLLSQEVLALSAAGFGLLLAAGAAGGVTAGLAGPWIAKRLGGQTCVLLALCLMPLPFLVLALTHNPYLAGAALFAETFAGLLWNIVTVSYRQRRIPEHLLGRVNSIYRFFGWGMMPLGALAGGWLVGLGEDNMTRDAALRLPFIAACVGSSVMALYGLFRLRLQPANP